MTVSQELMLAILSMDSYNRGNSGDKPGIDLTLFGASTTNIGNATIRTDALPNGYAAAELR
jgi:uncharacterized protein (UPF0261 family)